MNTKFSRTSRGSLLLALLSLVAACTAADAGESSDAFGDSEAQMVTNRGCMDLPDSTWRLSRLHGQALHSEQAPTLRFGEQEIDGSAGCNRFWTKYDAEEGRIRIGPNIASTKKFCFGLMQQEYTYLNALREATSYRMEGNLLTLRNARDEVVASFEAVCCNCER